VDGKYSLWVRDVDSLAARPLPGTEGGIYPLWSPDSRTIAFFADGKLKKVEVAGGPVLTLCDYGAGARGGTWSKNDVIVFGAFRGAFRVPAAGGRPAPATKLEAGEVFHRFPWFLPDGRHFLYTAIHPEPEKTAIYVAALDSQERKLIVAAASNAVYTPPGYLLFVRERALLAQPFDAAKLQTTGDAIPIAEQVDSARGTLDQNQFSASQNGVLVYTSGVSGDNVQLTWFDHSGKVAGTLGERAAVNWGAISPDERTVAVYRMDPQSGLFDIWLYDLARGTASRFTFGPGMNECPVWSPDGRHIAFYSTRDGPGHPFQRAVAGTGRDEVLDKPAGDPPRVARVDDWSRDGRFAIEASVPSPTTKFQVWVVPLFPAGGERKPFPYLQSEFNERWARLSPNGQWLAYASDESKRYEIYVQTFPTPGGKWQVSTQGGTRPVWSRDGKELYFIGPDRKLMAVEIKGGIQFEAAVPKPLFDVRFPGGNSWFAVSKDGRFLIPVSTEQSASAPMTVVVNWQAGLKK
jgi:Tol biopolymer transport system component